MISHRIGTIALTSKRSTFSGPGGPGGYGGGGFGGGYGGPPGFGGPGGFDAAQSPLDAEVQVSPLNNLRKYGFLIKKT